MGFTRKVFSIGTAGLIDFRSDKERTAAYTRASRNEARKQTRLMRRQVKAARRQERVTTTVTVTPAVGASVPAGWYPDPTREAAQRWWDGSGWTGHTT